MQQTRLPQNGHQETCQSTLDSKKSNRLRIIALGARNRQIYCWCVTQIYPVPDAKIPDNQIHLPMQRTTESGFATHALRFRERLRKRSVFTNHVEFVVLPGGQSKFGEGDFEDNELP